MRKLSLTLYLAIFIQHAWLMLVQLISKDLFSDMNEIGRQRRKKRKRKENWKQKRRQSASAETVTPTTATRGHSSSRRWRARPRTRSTFAASAKSSSFYLGQRTVLLWYLSSSSSRWRPETWGTRTKWPTRSSSPASARSSSPAEEDQNVIERIYSI